LAGLASGDTESAAAFVRRFQSRVFGLAVTILSDRGAAEEAAQEAFVRAWKHGDAYDPRRASVATWLLTITRNVAIDMARLRRSEPMDPHALIALHLSAPDEDVERQQEIALDSERLVVALRELPEEQLRSVVLASFYGRTAREISEMESAPLGTVKTRIRAAMFKLRAALEVADE
jgi:RNA polymerase sigma-70 factor (ECF subfamily)